MVWTHIYTLIIKILETEYNKHFSFCYTELLKHKNLQLKCAQLLHAELLNIKVNREKTGKVSLKA